MASLETLIIFFLLTSSTFSHATSPLANSIVPQRSPRILRTDSSNPDIKKAPPNGKTLSWSLSVFILPPSSDVTPSTELLHRTVRSLLLLNPTPDVILLGNHSFFASFVDEFPSSVRQESKVDFVFSTDRPDHHGLPLFHSVIARALLATSDLSMVLNADMALVNEKALSQSIRQTVRRFRKGFLMTWPRYVVSQLPAVLSNATKSKEQLAEDSALSHHVALFGRLETGGGAGAWLWNNNGDKLYGSDMPPFPADRSELDTWLAHAALLGSNRAVVEGGTSVVCASIRRSGGEGRLTELESKRKDFAFVRARRVGGRTEGEEEEEMKELWPSRNPLIVKNCHNDNVKLCLGTVNCASFFPWSGNKDPSPPDNENSNLDAREMERQKWLCEAVAPKPQLTAEGLENSFQIKDSMTLNNLLPIMADDRKIVTVVAVSNGYRDMLMNFICTLRRIGLRDPLVAALDDELYRFAMTLGLPVYLEKFDSVAKSQVLDCVFGTACFREVTKSKPQIVLKILKLGYNVLWTDVDIVWFRDPIKEFYECGPHTFPVQSDAPNSSRPANSRGFKTGGTINSGFYFARSEPLVIRALETIIEHSMEHKAPSEQPSFYKILCGEDQERLVGDNECIWNGLRTIFLSRNLHPNGGVYRLWTRNVTRECEKLGCATIHNNFYKGKIPKIKRMKARKLWFWTENSKVCVYDDDKDKF